MAKRAGTSHNEICLGEETLLESLKELLPALDEPSIDGPNVYAISQAVRAQGVTVVLSGQGADELLGGYSSFRHLNTLSYLQPVLRCLSPNFLGGVASAMEAFTTPGSRMDRVSQLLCASKSVLSSYLALHQMVPARVRARLLPGSEGRRLGLPSSLYDELNDAIHGLHTINQVSVLEMASYLGNMLLRDGDCMSMAHSLEVRVPFLDRRIIDFLAPVSGPAKLSRSLPKPLLVRALADLLPKPIYNRRKQGFSFPWQRWLRQKLRGVVEAVLDRRECGVELGFAPGECQRIWRSFLENPAAPWTVVWALFVLVDWCARYNVGIPHFASGRKHAALFDTMSIQKIGAHS
jgi:asparagine synthase (glutamine-hydrolysing)